MTEIFTKTPVEDQSTASDKRRKRIMRTFKINEISAVDYGAQEPAKAVLIKRAYDGKDPKGKKKKKKDMVEKMLILTSEDEGHQHVLYLDMDSIRHGGGHTSYASGSPDQHGHDHPYVINSDGSITIAADNGHTHSAELGELAARLKLTAALADAETTAVMVSKKIEGGKEFVASDYALVPDATDPKTWKYRLVRRSGSNPDRRLVGNVVSDLRKGQVSKDESATVIRRVRHAWLKAHVGKSRSQMPSVLKRATV